MKLIPSLAIIASLLVSAAGMSASAALITNAPMPIDLRVTVQPIVVSNNDGTNTAEFFGNAIQQAEIITFVDTIWAQAGIDIDWLLPTTWNNTFANIGSSDPRPTNDLDSIVAAGDAAGVGNADPNVLDIYFVEVAAGFDAEFFDTSNNPPVNITENVANGLAFVDGNGITQHVGDNLVGFDSGQEVVASVVAHEIGHNLGLDHTMTAGELMQSGGPGPDGERLNTAQIATARSSVFAVAVPEPGSLLALFGITTIAVIRRRRAASVTL